MASALCAPAAVVAWLVIQAFLAPRCAGRHVLLWCVCYAGSRCVCVCAASGALSCLLEAHAGLVQCTEEKCMRCALGFWLFLLGPTSAAVCTPCTPQHPNKAAGLTAFGVRLYHINRCTQCNHQSCSGCCAVLRWAGTASLSSLCLAGPLYTGAAAACCWAGAGSRMHS